MVLSTLRGRALLEVLHDPFLNMFCWAGDASTLLSGSPGQGCFARTLTDPSVE